MSAADAARASIMEVRDLRTSFHTMALSATRLKEPTTSAAVTAVPSWNFRPSLSPNVQVRPSALVEKSFTRKGWRLKLASGWKSASCMWRFTWAVTIRVVHWGSRDFRLPCGTIFSVPPILVSTAGGAVVGAGAVVGTAAGAVVAVGAAAAGASSSSSSPPHATTKARANTVNSRKSPLSRFIEPPFFAYRPSG